MENFNSVNFIKLSYEEISMYISNIANSTDICLDDKVKLLKRITTAYDLKAAVQRDSLSIEISARIINERGCYLSNEERSYLNKYLLGFKDS